MLRRTGVIVVADALQLWRRSVDRVVVRDELGDQVDHTVSLW